MDCIYRLYDFHFMMMVFNLLIWLFIVGAKFPASSLKEQEVRAYREIERQSMHKTLDEYLLFCRRMGVIGLGTLSKYE